MRGFGVSMIIFASSTVYQKITTAFLDYSLLPLLMPRLNKEGNLDLNINTIQNKSLLWLLGINGIDKKLTQTN